MAESDRSKKETPRARREVQPLGWEELIEEQRDAARQACGILGDIAGQKAEAGGGRSQLQTAC
ncbi:Hypothetical protein CAP_6218 [Chondromyces apiculatus DSM 436]|uniref:Uncharacterized protein n=2 Tax=Chondromyces apiculatus TaxID=51 RepID=A0A017T1I3_9BACT|nr:Hypothetical protein CAP_6218 [Chondromyces apiculatus DSM 436]